MGWIDVCDIVRENIAENGVALEIGGPTYLNNEQYIYGKSADGSTDINLLGINSSNNTLVGYGHYGNSLGGTYIYGNNTVSVCSKGNFIVTSPTAGLSSKPYGVNKILSTPGMFMVADHTAYLSEAVSAQPHGIVLIWCYYSNSQAQDYGWNYCFIPKYAINFSTGSSFFMSCGADTAGAKYLYIKDTRINGHDDNRGSHDFSGLTAYNSNWVLKYVVGV